MLTNVFGQLPSSFHYQSVLRDSSGELIVSQELTLDIQILQGGPEGDAVFSETHTTNTDEFGVVNLKIGSTTPIENIDWDEDIFYLNISVDGTLASSVQLVSVPFAMHSKMAGDAFSGNYEDLDNLPDLESYIALEGEHPGSMLIFSEGEWSLLPPGHNGQALIIRSGSPVWDDLDESGEE